MNTAVLLRVELPDWAARSGSGSGSGYGYGSGYGSGDGYGYGYGSGDGYGSGSGYGYGSGDGYGSGYGDGSGSGSGSGYGSGYGYGYGYGYGSGDGYGSGSGDGSGSGSGSGYGSGYGYGDGDGSYWSSTISYFAAKWTEAQRARLGELQKLGAKVAFWRSTTRGTAANGGDCTPVAPGTVHKEPGPLRDECGSGQLHATLIPPKWQGERWWVVALLGEVRGDDEKYWALEREVLGECL